MSETKRARNYGFSYLRAVACLGIVILHTVNGAVSTFGQETLSFWNVVYRSIQNNMMWAVPCFVMITGALLLDPRREVTFSKLFTKYILRVLEALGIFGLFYVLFELLLEQVAGGEAITLSWIWSKVYGIISGNTWSHMWYIYCLIGLYLMLPIYRLVAKGAGRREIEYLLLVLFVFRSVFRLLETAGVTVGFYIHVSSIYPFYLFLGYYLMRYFPFGKIDFSWVVVAIAGSALCLTVFTIIVNRTESAFFSKLTDYTSLFVAIQATALFILFQEIEIDPKTRLHPYMMLADSCSFGIYMIHMVFLRLFVKVLKINVLVVPVLGVLVLAAFIYALSFLAIFYLRKIKFFKAFL